MHFSLFNLGSEIGKDEKQPRLHHFLCKVLAKQAVPLLPARTERGNFSWEVGGGVLGAAAGLFVFCKGPRGPKAAWKLFVEAEKKKTEHQTWVCSAIPKACDYTVGFFHSPCTCSPCTCAVPASVLGAKSRAAKTTKRLIPAGGFCECGDGPIYADSSRKSFPFPHSRARAGPFVLDTLESLPSPASLVYYGHYLSPL